MKVMSIAIALLLGVTYLANAKTESKSLQVKDGYIFQPMKGSIATGGYGLIENTSGKEATLTVVSADGFKAVELHETISEKGLMKMKKIETVHLSKNGIFDLKPGGNHIMFFDATKEFKEGDLVEVTFDLDKKRVILPFKIRQRVEAPHAHH